jgi:hypothetical protein
MARRYKRGASEQSAGWHEAKRHFQRCCAELARIREELLHYASRRVVDSGPETVIMRKPGVLRLTKKSGKIGRGIRVRNVLAPRIQGAGWYELRRQIEYKQAWAMIAQKRAVDGSFIEAPTDHPTSRICSVCGAVRERPTEYPDFVCRGCMHREDRDDNASRVLRDFRPPSGEPKAGGGTPRRKAGSTTSATAGRTETYGVAAPATAHSDGDAINPLGSGNGTALTSAETDLVIQESNPKGGRTRLASFETRGQQRKRARKRGDIEPSARRNTKTIPLSTDRHRQGRS